MSVVSASYVPSDLIYSLLQLHYFIFTNRKIWARRNDFYIVIVNRTILPTLIYILGVEKEKPEDLYVWEKFLK